MTQRKKYGAYDSIDDYFTYFLGDMEGWEPIAFYLMVDSAIVRFGLIGQDRINFLNRCITTALDLGGIPCVPGYPDINEEWVYQPKYGSTREEIRDAILAEWVANGADRMQPWTGPWFGLPKQVYPFSETHSSAD